MPSFNEEAKYPFGNNFIWYLTKEFVRKDILQCCSAFFSSFVETTYKLEWDPDIQALIYCGEVSELANALPESAEAVSSQSPSPIIFKAKHEHENDFPYRSNEKYPFSNRFRYELNK